MKRDHGGTFLSAIFVDYDNIYLSLKRKNDEAAKRFAKDAPLWIKAIESGALITPTNGPNGEERRRLVMNRCYGNPVPRRSTNDNSTDMSSFPFVRHHFLRSGFEIVDCPPLTAQLKNSSDIRMVMDVRDYLTHPTYFDEFVILSGDADFTPVLHRLRAHARRTVIFANDYTAAPYTAISDGEVRESDLIKFLLENRTPAQDTGEIAGSTHDLALVESARREIIADVVAAVRTAGAPVPLEVLADRAVRAIGHDKTIGTSWAGAGNFRDLLGQVLPEGLRVSSEAPYVVIDTARHSAPAQHVTTTAPLVPTAQVRVEKPPAPRITTAVATGTVQAAAKASAPSSQSIFVPVGEQAPARAAAAPTAQALQPEVAPKRQTQVSVQPRVAVEPQVEVQARAQPPQAPVQRAPTASANQPMRYVAASSQPEQTVATQPRQQAAVSAQRTLPPEAMAPRTAPAQHHAAPPQAPPQMQRPAEPAATIQQSIARIHEACQAPPLAPPEYRMLFEVMAQEINENGLIGAQTILNIAHRALEQGIDIRRDDVRFVLEVVSEADPWFEQGASANLFAGRFRNFVVARCRSQGLDLSADELDLIEAWFAGSGTGLGSRPPSAPVYAPAPQHHQQSHAPRPPVQNTDPRLPSWQTDEHLQAAVSQRAATRADFAPPIADQPGDDFPRIVRTRLRG